MTQQTILITHTTTRRFAMAARQMESNQQPMGAHWTRSKSP